MALSIAVCDPNEAEIELYSDNQIGNRLSRAFGLDSKVAVVTGAAQGLGAATACLFAEVGAQVAIADYNIDKARKVAQQIEDAGGIATAFHVDVSDQVSVKGLFDAVDSRFSRLDVLVNNVALRTKAEFFDMSVRDWDSMFEVTVRGTFLCSREALLRMTKSGGGAIVNISSIGAMRTTLWGVNAHYDAAKAAVDSLTRSLSSEFAAQNVRVNSVLPGGMSSEGGRSISAGYKIRGPMIMPGRIPMGRTADPAEIAQCVLFLASSAASYVTGQTLAADGGFSVS